MAKIPSESHPANKNTAVQQTQLELDLATILLQENVDATIIDDIQSMMGTIVDDQLVFATTLDGPEEPNEALTFDLFEEDHFQDMEDLSEFPEYDPERYQDRGLLGAGSMGEVRLLFDKVLNREVACKTIHSKLQSHTGILSRFIEEAQVVSQLQHSNIVPIHEIGVMPDNSIYFTMQVIRGKPFSKFIQEVHQAVDESGWQQTDSGWGFHRLIDVFVKICETMHFAHKKGVIHRDLKPDNIMIGEYGEVLIVDWGVCKILGRTHSVDEHIESTRFDEGIHATRIGQITGTPAYMPPEQAKGDIEGLDHRSDIYALGAILYHIISGQPPYTGQSGQNIITQVLTGPPTPVHRTLLNRTATAFGKSRSQLSMEMSAITEAILQEQPESPHQFSAPIVSMDLVRACEKAMCREMNDRHDTAKELAEVIKAWREGTKRTEQAQNLTQQAINLTAEIERLETEGHALISAAEKALFTIPGWDTFAKKLPHWKNIKLGQDHLEQAARLSLRKEFLLQNALMHRSDHLEANSEMLKLLQQTHQSMNDSVLAQGVAKRMEGHLDVLSEMDPLRVELSNYLAGTGDLTLVTDVDGASVYISTIREVNRLLVETEEHYLGKTPILHHPLEMGSYLLTIRKEGYHDVRYPVFIERNTSWNGIAPGEDKPHPIVLPPLGTLEDGMCYVPAGWFVCGGDPNLPNCFPKTKVWVDGFVIGQYHVTVDEYMESVNDILKRGNLSVSEEMVPGMQGLPFANKGADGAFSFFHPLFPDKDFSDLAITWIDTKCGMLYCRWLSERTGKKWRLPYEIEFEKGARGVDGRFFPMGNHYDPTWILTDDTPFPQIPAGKDEFLRDRSIYGLRFMAGNIADWSYGSGLTKFAIDSQGRHLKEFDDITEPTVEVSCRGGASMVNQRYARGAYRQFYASAMRPPCVSFRIVRTIQEKKP